MVQHIPSPVNADGHEREDGRGDTEHGHELAELAVEVPERPVRVQHVRVVEHHVEG